MRYLPYRIDIPRLAAIGLAVLVVQFASCNPEPTAMGETLAPAEKPTTDDRPNIVAESSLSRYKIMKPLGAEEARMIRGRETERAFTGAYHDHFEQGIYHCRQCGAPLYLSDHKFKSTCGWPSFDDELSAAVYRRADPDGLRTEIVCTSCGGHIGHVFTGERLTEKNMRHCVNSISMVFKPARPIESDDEEKTARAIFAGGCFWGVEHLMQQTPGVIDVQSGYTGGFTPDPTYKTICTGRTGHAEAVLVRYDPEKVSYAALARLFFEIHDPTQAMRQGPDSGSQYRSAVYYFDEAQKATIEKLIGELRSVGWDVVTQIAPAGTFYPAEAEHQDFLENNPGRPVCHRRVERFKHGPGS